METVEIRFRGVDLIQSFEVPVTCSKESLQELINDVTQKSQNWFFLLSNTRIESSLLSVIQQKSLTTQECLIIDAFVQSPPPQQVGSHQQQDWISQIKIHGDWIITSNYSGSICYIGQTINTYKAEEGPIKDFDLLQDDSLLLGCRKGSLKVFNGIQQLIDFSVEKLKLNQNKGLFCVGGSRGQLYVGNFNQTAQQEIGFKKRKLNQGYIHLEELNCKQSDCITGIDWYSIDTVVSSSADHSLICMDIERQAIINSLLAPRSIQAMTLKDEVCYIGYENGTTQSVDMRTFTVRITQKIQKTTGNSWVRSLLAKDLNLFLVLNIQGREDGKIEIFDVRNLGFSLHQVEAHSGKILAMDVQNGLLVSGGSDSIVHSYRFN